jgi:two-component system, OmpR family, response regulator BaeR
MNRPIIVVEDEPKIAALIADYLSRDGFIVHHLLDGTTLQQAIKSHNPQLILLDVMLPVHNGFELLAMVRSITETPVIFVTARMTEADMLSGLDAGADDYIIKPFRPLELLARVRAVIRRANPDFENANTAADHRLMLHKETHSILYMGRSTMLTVVEYALISVLMASPKRIFERGELMDRIYVQRHIVHDRTIDSHIRKLRRKLEALIEGDSPIQAVYGVGYKYEWTDSKGSSLV